MLAQTIAPKPTALPPAVQPSLPASSAGGPSFAQFLTDQASPPAPPPQTDAEPSPPQDAATAEEPAPTAPTATPRRSTAQGAKPAAQNRTAEATPKADTNAAPTDKTNARAATDAIAADDAEAAETPELKEFTQLIGIQAAVPDATAAAAKPEAHRGRAAAAVDDARQGRAALNAMDAATAASATATATADKDRATDQPTAAAAKLGELRADKATARAAAEPLQVTTEQAGKEAPGATAPPAAPSFSAVLAQALPTPAAPPDAASATTYANVQAPLHGPAFAPELGARVSLMAVDGVQHAELQLNPTDMGPVTVQIVVDGSQAQVSFHALQAETRQALEQSLPDLAAALQGQGLTLSGGGVFQQAQRDADQADDQPGADAAARDSRGGNGRVGGSAANSAATGPTARRSVGLLDTFA